MTYNYTQLLVDYFKRVGLKYSFHIMLDNHWTPKAYIVLANGLTIMYMKLIIHTNLNGK